MPTAVLFAFFLLLPWFGLAQKFVVVDKLKVENGSIDGARIVIEKDGQRVKTITASAKNTYELDFQANYIISYEKDGYVTKRIFFDTHVPEDRVAYGFLEFAYEVFIFKQYEGVNTIVFNQPVGKIFYSEDIDEFDYDTDYTKSIQAQLEAIQEQIEEKIAEEAEEIAEEEKRQAQIEKQVSSFVSSGDKSASSGKLEDALASYQKALEIKDDPSIQQKISDINKQIEANQAQQENQARFEGLIASAEKAMSEGDMAVAKKDLAEAQALIASDPRPGKMLAEIESAEKEAAQAQQQFEKLIGEAKAELSNEAFAPAIAKLEEAKKLQPGNVEAESLLKTATAGLEEAERRKQAAQAQEEEFNNLVAAADKDMEQGNLAEAASGYEAALAIKPSEEISAKVATVKAQIEEEDRKKAAFEELLSEAGKSLASGDMESARNAYSKAGEMFDDPRVKEGLAAVEQKENEKKEAEKAAAIASAEAAEAEKKAGFEKLLAEAEGALAKGQLEQAKSLFEQAGEMFEDKRVTTGLKSVEKAMAEATAAKEAEAAKQTDYNNAIKEADALLQSGDLNNAERLYKDALAIMDEDYPKQKIDEIARKRDQIAEEEARNAASEAEKQAAEQKRKEYDALIAKADGYFDKNELDKAAEGYSQALALLNEQYPGGQLEKIKQLKAEMAASEAAEAEREAALNAEAETQKRYTDAIARADAAFDDEEWENARGLYTKALEIKDGPYPKERIAAVDKALAEIEAAEQAALSEEAQRAKMEEKNKEYEAIIAKADGAFDNKDWNAAKSLYGQALEVKQDDYPRSQLTKIEKAIEAEEKKAAERAASAIAKNTGTESSPEREELARVIENVEKPIQKSEQRPANVPSPAIIVSDPRPVKAAVIQDPEREEKIFDGIQKKAEMDLKKFNEEEQQKALAAKYTSAKTVEVEETANTKTTFIYINRNGFVTTYKKVEHNWGGVFYFINNRSTTQRFWEHETK